MPGLAVLALVLAVSGAAAAVTRGRHDHRVAVRSTAPPPSRPLATPGSAPAQQVPQPESSPRPRSEPVDGPAPGAWFPSGSALIDVAVATLWIEPGQARPIDAPSLTNPADVRGWVGSMSVDDKLWLVGRLATQALYGDRVIALETSGAWTRVVVADQPSSLDARGYPGWLPTRQLAPGSPVPDSSRYALVTAPATTLRDAGPISLPGLELSYGTRLPVLGVEGPGVAVATPGGGRGVLARSDVDVVDGGTRGSGGGDLVRSAQMFSGLGYLWAGTSAAGFDCSGLTWAVYRAHGIVIPRDADDQAAAGSAVDLADLRPGDLLFYGPGGQDTIHHVAMYAGDGRMVQSPATGRAVETVAVATSELSGEFWSARRLLP